MMVLWSWTIDLKNIVKMENFYKKIFFNSIKLFVSKFDGILNVPYLTNCKITYWMAPITTLRF